MAAPEYPKRACYDPLAVVWPAGNVEDEFSTAVGSEQMRHKAQHAITGIVTNFHEPSQYGFGWVRIRPSVPWNLPGMTEEQKMDENGNPVVDEEDRPVMERVLYAVPRDMAQDKINRWERGSVVAISPYPYYSRSFNAVAFSYSLAVAGADRWSGPEAVELGNCRSKSLTAKYVWTWSTNVDGSEPWEYGTSDEAVDFRELLSFLHDGDFAINPGNQYIDLVTNSCFLMRADAPDPAGGTIHRYYLLDLEGAEDVSPDDLSLVIDPPIYLSSAICSLTPAYQCELVAAPRRSPTPVHWSFTTVQPLPGHLNADQLNVGWIEFPRPMMPYNGLHVAPLDGLSVLLYDRVGVWPCGKPTYVDPDGEAIDIDMSEIHVYPAPFISHKGEILGMVVGVPPKTYDSPILSVRDDFPTGQPVPDPTPAEEWVDPDAPP